MSFVSVEDEISIENFTLTVYSQDTNIVTSERLINKTILKLLEKAD